MSKVGFCSKCGFIRQDGDDGVVELDCPCTAKRYHSADCQYVKCLSCPVSVGMYCVHGVEACEICDCTCALKHLDGWLRSG